MIRLVIVDDEAMVRSGLRLLVDGEEDVEVVAEAGDGLQALEIVRQTKPDVVLMDIRMPRMDGLAATERLLELPDGPRVIVLTTFDEDEHVYEALRLGASGFLLKASPPEELLEAIRVVAEGKALIDPAVTQRVIEQFALHSRRREPPPALDELTGREREVLDLLARAKTNAEIAGALFLSEATVKSHVNRILMKLGLRDRIQAVVFAYEHGLVRPGDA